MTLNIKKRFTVVLIAVVAALCTILCFTDRDRSGLEAFRSENGWGYSIKNREKVVIYQPYIPALEGNNPFRSRREALKAGRMVITKINEGTDYTLTIDELTKAGIGI
jgi:hypothetical protein